MKKNGDFDIGWRSCVKEVVFYCCLILCVSLLSMQTYAQQATKQENAQKTVRYSGKVIDKAGNVLPGVTIVLQGTSIGVTTDANGEFVLTMPEATDAKLVFSFIGMKTKVVTLKDDKPLLVVMEEEATAMDEVVVTGIFERKRSDFTGSASTFTADKLKEVGNQNIIQSLKSLDPAFAIIESNEWGSDPNRLPDIEIRGKTSIIGMRESLEADPNQPLFILDGFETTLQTIVDLDMDRVASITILKDAASTAIYGSKAANGVVVVETKAPAAGQLRVTYTGNFNFQLPDLSSYNLMNAEEKVAFEDYANRYKVSAFGGTFEQAERLQELHNNHLRSVARGVDTYWLSEPLRMGFNHRHSLYAEGGDEHMRYGFGLSYNGVTGVMKESKKNVFSGNLDLLYRRGKLQFSNKLTVNLSNSGDPVVNFSTYAAANPYYEKRVDGQVEKWLEYVENYIEAPNPLWNASLNSRSLKRSFGVTDNFSVEYNPLDALKLRGRIGVTRNTDESDSFISPEDTRYEDTEELKKGTLNYGNT
ncbi:MAG: carboxypeptidase-like regulatory domain-containing protein [Odoribacter sp.]|nr:carboxypeptidase-like regulatory domain-containing protein [Odoribacter sp.]